MFDISWSELLILAVVTLIFVGPKELPVFLRTIGRYAGMAKRQAAEFRSQFDAAMRESELDTMREEVEKMQSTINNEVMSGKRAVLDAAKEPQPSPTLGHTAATATAAPAPTSNDARPQPPRPATPGEGR